MLFPYTYISHTMEKMQSFIEYIFFEVWCNAPSGKPFGFELFDSNPELKILMESFYYSDTQGGDFFYSHVERIYGLFASLAPAQISQLQAWFIGNNDIAGLCRNDPDVTIAGYTDLETLNQPLSKALAVFFKGLYSQDVLGLAALRSAVGEMSNHYEKFCEVNNQGKCPFCGINDIKGIYHTKREAYDHYLPKSKYPFNSINLHNLAPACHECNSTYKHSKDPLYNPKDPLIANTGNRRKSFYPYTTDHHEIEIRITLNAPDWTGIKPGDITLDFGPSELNEELETWKDIYGIEERYKAKCCGENDGKGWIEEVRIFMEKGLTLKDYFKIHRSLSTAKPYTDDNFLKQPFLDACNRSGLFDI